MKNVVIYGFILLVFGVLVRSLSFYPFYFDKSLDERLKQFSQGTGLNCTVQPVGLYHWIKKTSSVYCEDPAFSFTDGRDGTSKTEVSEEFMLKFKFITEQTWGENTSVGFMPLENKENFELTCYSSQNRGAKWFLCKSKNCLDCELAYSMD